MGNKTKAKPKTKPKTKNKERIITMEMLDDKRAVENLCNAIISTTCRDFSRAYHKGDMGTAARLQRTIRSPWFYELGLRDPEYVLEKIKKYGICKSKNKVK